MMASMHGEVSFEHRDFMHDSTYPSMGDHHIASPEADNFTTHHDTVVNELTDGVNYNDPGIPQFDGADEHLDLDTHPAQVVMQATPPPNDRHLLRNKAIPKPNRKITKNGDGKYICEHVGCEEEVKTFGRKCEWSKHMDKHERPYRCNEDGCEKLPGFTYSGGLLRHEREVHQKHGGPKKPLTCPHQTCKRYNAKPFSRQENLNEHLRRVHTPGGIPEAPSPSDNGNDDNDNVSNNTPPPRVAGVRRKRSDDDIDVILQENKRLKQENIELRQQVNQQTLQTSQLIQQLQGAMLGTGPMI